MRFVMMPLLGLLALGPHVPLPQNFTPIPVAHGCRPTDACLQRCRKEGGQDCYQACDRCRR